MSELLERRYRRLLRMLPKHYRESRGEELLGALMEGAGERRRRPELREALGLAGLSLRTRFRPAGADSGERGTSLSGESTRATAFLASAVLAVYGVDQLVTVLMYQQTLFAGWPGRGYRRPDGTMAFHTDVVKSLHMELPGLWVVVFALLVAGWWWAARALALGEFGFAVTQVHHSVDAAQAQLALAAVATAAVLLARGAGTRRVGGRWLVAAGGVVALVLGVFAIALWDVEILVTSNPHRPGPSIFRMLWVGDWLVPDTRAALAVTVLAFAAAGVLAWRSAAWPLAITVVGSAVLGALVVDRTVFTPLFLDVRGGTGPAAAVVGGLLAITLFALLKERLAQRSAEPTPAG